MADIKKEKLIKLVEKSKEGDNAAFGELYSIYYDELIRIALKHTSGKHDVAEDIVQDSMVKAMKNINNLDNPIAFPSWIDRIVINRCKDYISSYAVKNNSTFSELSKTTEDDEIEFDPEDNKLDSDPAEKLSIATRDKIVQEIIAGLSDDQKAVTLLYYYDEMSIKEVAEALNIQQSTVIGRLQTAKKNIKSEVTAIQKKYDLKLYDIAPWPFFLYLLGKAKKEIQPFPGETHVSEKPQTDATSKGTSNAHNRQSKINETDIYDEKICSQNGLNYGSEETNIPSSSSNVADVATVKAVTGMGAFTKFAIAIGVAVTVSAGGYVIYKNNSSNSNQAPIVESSTYIHDGENIAENASSETSSEEKNTIKQVEVITNKVLISIPDSWYIEQSINQNPYITKIHLSDNSYIQIRSDRPDGGAGGSYSIENASEKIYGNLTFWEIDSSDSEGHTGSLLFHTASNSYGDDGSLKNGDWYDYIIQTYDVDMDDHAVQDAIASIKVKMDCKVKVIVDQLNIRNDFSTTAAIYSTAKQGDSFEVYRTVLSSMPEATWYQVLIDGQWKWLCGGSNNEYVERIETIY